MTRAIFYRTFACEPYFNMAFDEWLFRQAVARPATVFLRLYTWRLGAITFGLNQRIESALNLVQARDTTVIRRLTGGRALYHDASELTYALGANTDGLGQVALAGTLAQSSHCVARALASFVSCLGIACDYARVPTGGSARPEFFHKAPCFASTARHEVVSGARKIVASAQRRVGPAFLQHGSIKLRGVATHPALHLEMAGCVAVGSLPAIAEDEFKPLADIFLEVMSTGLDLPFREERLSAADREEVCAAAETLRQHALHRREIF
jgi:lipoate-protein ligase A